MNDDPRGFVSVTRPPKHRSCTACGGEAYVYVGVGSRHGRGSEQTSVVLCRKHSDDLRNKLVNYDAGWQPGPREDQS